jgi:hypothetical protein
MLKGIMSLDLFLCKYRQAQKLTHASQFRFELAFERWFARRM